VTAAARHHGHQCFPHLQSVAAARIDSTRMVSLLDAGCPDCPRFPMRLSSVCTRSHRWSSERRGIDLARLSGSNS
jgi:hypothetical protein